MRPHIIKSLLITILLLINMPHAYAQSEMALSIKSFADHSPIPARYTCSGYNISPALSWSHAPAGTKSFALIVDDPDAPSGMWVHWVAYNIPAHITMLNEGVIPNDIRFKQGVNDFKKIGYGGPCPPRGHGQHRYMFKLYALDTILNPSQPVTKSVLEAALNGHVLAQSVVTGTYQRNAK